MSAKQPPLLRVGPLTHRVYLVTRYRELPNGIIEAIGPKVDVTNQVGAVLEELDRLGLELRPSAVSAVSEGDETT